MDAEASERVGGAGSDRGDARAGRARARRARLACNPRSKNAETPFADVNTTHAQLVRSGTSNVDRLDRDRGQLHDVGAERGEPRP